MKTWKKLTRQLLLALSSSPIYKWFDLVGLYLWILLRFLSCIPLLKIIVIAMSFKLNKSLIGLEVSSSMGSFLVLQILASKIQNSSIYSPSILTVIQRSRHVLFSCNLFPVRISVAHTFFFSLKKIHQTAPPTYYFIPPWFLPLPEPPAKNMREKIKQVFRYFASCFFTHFILRH